MRLVHGLLAATLLCCIAACDKQAWFDKFVPKEESEAAKRFIAAFGARDYAAIEQQLEPSLLAADTRPKLLQIVDQFPEAQPLAVEIVGAYTHTSSGQVIYDLTYQLQYPNKWLLAKVVMQRKDGQLKVAGVHVNPLADSLQNLNRFTFSDKGPLHWAVLALAVAIPLFVLATLVACARTPVPRRKWLWLLFIAVGFVQLSLNWTDGAVNVTPLSFLLLGAGFTQAGPAAPYIITVALPVGAALFWLKRRSWVVRGAA